MRWMAIDPGASGGIVVRMPDGKVASYKIPESPEAYPVAFRSILSETNPGGIIIERQTGCAGFRVSAPAMFKFGVGYGTLLGLTHMLPNVQWVAPQVWQKAIGMGKSGRKSRNKKLTPEQNDAIRNENDRLKANWKRLLADEAERRFPNVKVTLKNADALLMLSFAEEFLDDPANRKFWSATGW